MYRMMLSSMVTRPKSIATVVVVLPGPAAPTWSTVEAAMVIAASVVSGSISDSAPIIVVLPTPNPPETTIFTGTGGGVPAGRRSWGSAARPVGVSECSDTGDQPFEEVDVLRLAGSDHGSVEQPVGDQIGDQHQRHGERQVQPGGHLRRRARPGREPQDPGPLHPGGPGSGQPRGAGGLHHGLHRPQRAARAGPPPGEQVRADLVDA